MCYLTNDRNERSFITINFHFLDKFLMLVFRPKMYLDKKKVFCDR